MRIAIVTDSTADIPADLVRELDIKVIPLAVHFGGKAYLDRVDITNQEFYDYIGTAKTLPTTSQPYRHSTWMCTVPVRKKAQSACFRSTSLRR